MNTINIISSIIALISIVQWLFITIVVLYKYFKDKRYLNKTMQFENKSCNISLSIFRKDLYSSQNDYITLYSVKSYDKIRKLLERGNILVEPMSDSYDTNNTFYIGGPSSNNRVCAIIEKFPCFKFYTQNHQKATYEKHGVHQHFIIYDDVKKGFMFDEKFFEIDSNSKDIGIFIRIPKNSKDGIESTTHILFAAWDIGTYNAVEFFVNNYKTIAKRFDDKPYCFVIPISRIDHSPRIISANEIIDVSEEFFKNSYINM